MVKLKVFSMMGSRRQSLAEIETSINGRTIDVKRIKKAG
jgi:hypothetical protein